MPQCASARQTGSVLGPAIIIFVLLVFIPVSVMMTGGIVAAILGYFIKEDVDEDYEGTEYIELA